MPNPRKLFAQKKVWVEGAPYPLVFDPSGELGHNCVGAVVSATAFGVDKATGKKIPLHCWWSHEATGSLTVQVFDNSGAEMSSADATWQGRKIEVHVIAANPTA
ncbi:MAG: hypothetical protein M0R80_26005 [Proteobacteria bacterium]|nr:hypothetical protein [Pseudomonadota bacterium]